MAFSDDVKNFMNITGASEYVAVQTLKEHGGDLNDAMNAYYLEEHKLSAEGKNLAADPQSGPSKESWIEYSKREKGECSSTWAKVDALDDSSDGLLSQTCESRPPLTSHREGVTEVSACEPRYKSAFSSDGIEEEMLQAAIEASKKEWRGGSSLEQIDCDDSSDGWLPKTHVQEEDSDLARAIELSIETAKKEKEVRENIVQEEELGVHDLLHKRKKPDISINQLETEEKETAACEIVVEEDEEDPQVHDLVDKRKKTNRSRDQLEVADDLVSSRADEEEEPESMEQCSSTFE